MKEAAGEANLTVITIVLIALVLAVGTVIVRSALRSASLSAACAAATGYWSGGNCYKDESRNTGFYYCVAKASSSDATNYGCEEGESCCY